MTKLILFSEPSDIIRHFWDLAPITWIYSRFHDLTSIYWPILAGIWLWYSFATRFLLVTTFFSSFLVKLYFMWIYFYQELFFHCCYLHNDWAVLWKSTMLWFDLIFIKWAKPFLAQCLINLTLLLLNCSSNDSANSCLFYDSTFVLLTIFSRHYTLQSDFIVKSTISWRFYNLAVIQKVNLFLWLLTNLSSMKPCCHLPHAQNLQNKKTHSLWKQKK